MHTPTRITRFHSRVSASRELATPFFPSFRLFRRGIYIARICIPNDGTSNNSSVESLSRAPDKFHQFSAVTNFFREAIYLVPFNPEFRKQAFPVKFYFPSWFQIHIDQLIVVGCPIMVMRFSPFLHSRVKLVSFKRNILQRLVISRKTL